MKKHSQLTEIKTTKAPAPVGAYSQAIAWNNLLFISGQIPLDAVSSELKQNTFKEEVETVLDNLEAVLKEGGADWDSVIKINAYLTDLSHFAEFNRLYETRIGKPYPARAVLGVNALPKGSRIEIEAIASIK